MYDHKDKLAVYGLVLKQFHHIPRVMRCQSRNRFVSKQHCRFAHQFQSYIQPLALPPADFLVQRITHQHVTVFVQIQFLQHINHNLVQFLLVIISEGEAGIIIQVLVDCKLLYQEVILRHIADQAVKLLWFVVEIIAIDKNRTVLRFQFAVEDVQKGAFADAAATHYAHKVTRLHAEAHRLYAVIRAFEVVFYVLSLKDYVLGEIGLDEFPEDGCIIEWCQSVGADVDARFQQERPERYNVAPLEMKLHLSVVHE